MYLRCMGSFEKCRRPRHRQLRHRLGGDGAWIPGKPPSGRWLHPYRKRHPRQPDIWWCRSLWGVAYGRTCTRRAFGFWQPGLPRLQLWGLLYHSIPLLLQPEYRKSDDGRAGHQYLQDGIQFCPADGFLLGRRTGGRDSGSSGGPLRLLTPGSGTVPHCRIAAAAFKRRLLYSGIWQSGHRRSGQKGSCFRYQRKRPRPGSQCNQRCFKKRGG